MESRALVGNLHRPIFGAGNAYLALDDTVPFPRLERRAEKAPVEPDIDTRARGRHLHLRCLPHVRNYHRTCCIHTAWAFDLQRNSVDRNPAVVSEAKPPAFDRDRIAEPNAIGTAVSRALAFDHDQMLLAAATGALYEATPLGLQSQEPQFQDRQRDCSQDSLCDDHHGSGEEPMRLAVVASVVFGGGWMTCGRDYVMVRPPAVF